jgi:uncharacterized protein YyaL (SSP411 family)
VDFSLQEPVRAVVTGDFTSSNTRELLRAIHSVYQPNKVVLGNSGAVEQFARTLPAKGEPTVYLCRATECQAPTNDAAKVGAMLRG